MKRILFLITFFAFGLITYGQRITALGESTTATGSSLMFVREGAVGDLIKRITKDNMLKDYAKLNSPAFLTQITIGGIAITPTSASYLDFTSSGQTQLNLKAPLASPTFTGTVVIPTPFTLGAVSVTTNGTRLNYLTSATGTTGDVTSNLVFSDSPAFLTPDLGTPSAIVLTNATGTAAGMVAGTVTGFTPAGGSLTLAGADALTLTTTGVTDVTFPTTGTLATTSQLYTNLTSFVDQTAWRVFYSNTDGDVTELALGASGTYLGSNGAAVAPTFSVPSGAGDVLKVGTPANDQVGIWTGDGTLEGDADLTFDGTTLTGAFLGNLTGSNGATIINTDADNLDIVEANVGFSGNVDIAGNATFGNSTTGSTLYVERLKDTTYVTDNYTLVLGDAGNWIDMLVATEKSLTIPPHTDVAIPVGTEIYIMQAGAGIIGITAGVGVTLAFPLDSTHLNTRYRSAFIRQWAEDKWVAGGLQD